MLRPALIAILVLSAAPAFAETRSYDFKSFKKIEASKGFTIRFIQSPTWSVKVDSRYNNLDKIVVEKDGDTLRISRPEGFCSVVTRDSRTSVIGSTHRGDCLDHDIDDVITISAPDLDAVRFHAGVQFTADKLKVDAFDINVDAGVDVEIADLTAGPVNIKARAGTKLVLAGSCSKLDLDLSAGSKADAQRLKCREATVDAGAASSVQAFASDKATARAGAVSKILISGHPKDFQKHQDGFSSSVSLAD